MLLLKRFLGNATPQRSLGLPSILGSVCVLVCVCFVASTFAQEPAHPTLLFDKNDLETLRAAVKSGWMKDAFGFMQSRADEYMAVSVDPYPMGQAKSTGRILNNQVSTLALTGLLTGDQRYCDHAVNMLVSAAKQKDVNYFVDLNHHLSVGDGAHAYAMGYDWLWEYMDQDQRKLLRNEIRSLGEWLYADSITGRGYGSFVPQNLSCNHNSVLHGGLGLCSLVLNENPQWLERAAKFVRGYLEHSIDQTGYSYEGVSYYGYGTWGAVPFGVAFLRAGHGDVFQKIKTLPKVPEYYLRQMVPGGGELVSMNDSPARIGSAGGLMYLISRYQDRIGLWTWLALHGKEGDGGFGDYPENYDSHRSDGASLPYTLLFVDPSLQPQSPKEADLELFKYFKSGRVSFRSGWGKLDALATFTCGFDRHRGHNHRDENSFTFFSRGERFAIDPGYDPKETRAHNTVLIDGMGQGKDKEEYDVYGKTKSFRDYDSAWLVTGEAADAFPDSMQVSKARRQFLFVNAEVPYIVIADEIKTKLGPTNYTWLFHTDRSNKIAIVQKKNAAYVKGSRRGAICKIEFIAPAEGLEISETNLKDETFERGGRTFRYDRFFKEIQAKHQADNGRSIVVIAAADRVKELPRVRSKGTPDDMWLEVRSGKTRVDTLRVTPSRITLKKVQL